jgi:hypothetical protein
MPSYIIKPDPTEDFYVLWSSVVEAPVCFGPKAYVSANGQACTTDRFARADETGCSAQWPTPEEPVYGWADAAGPIYMQRGFLPRANLKAACERLNADEDDPLTDLLVPFSDEDEVRDP